MSPIKTGNSTTTTRFVIPQSTPGNPEFFCNLMHLCVYVYWKTSNILDGGDIKSPPERIQNNPPGKEKVNKKHGQESNLNLGILMTQSEHTKDCVSFYSYTLEHVFLSK